LFLLAEDQRRNAEIQARLERVVEERTRQLLPSEQNFRLFFEAAPVAVWLVDTDERRVRMCNEAAPVLLSLPSRQLVEQPIPNLLFAKVIRYCFSIVSRLAKPSAMFRWRSVPAPAPRMPIICSPAVQ
jgi:PAS domain-containing protein